MIAVMQETPHKLSAAVDGPHDAVFTVLAGRAEPTGAAALKLMIASQHSNVSTVRVAVSGLPRSVTMRYSVVLTNQSGKAASKSFFCLRCTGLLLTALLVVPVVSGGIQRVSAAGDLELPPFEAPWPAVAFVRIEQEETSRSYTVQDTRIEQETTQGTAMSRLKSDDIPECLITAKIYDGQHRLESGGAVGGNSTVNTKAIQATIDQCHAKYPEGSRVVVPAGAFKTGSLMLRSNLELHLAAGAGLYLLRSNRSLIPIHQFAPDSGSIDGMCIPRSTGTEAMTGLSTRS